MWGHGRQGGQRRDDVAVNSSGQPWRSCVEFISAGHVCIATGRPNKQTMRCLEMTSGVDPRRVDSWNPPLQGQPLELTTEFTTRVDR